MVFKMSENAAGSVNAKAAKVHAKGAKKFLCVTLR
jgi:hypothetical protein